MSFTTSPPWYANGTITTDGTTKVVGFATNFTDIGKVTIGDMLTLDGTAFYQIQKVGDGTLNGDGTAGTPAGTQAGNNTILIVDRNIPAGATQPYGILQNSQVNPVNSDIAYKVSTMVQSWQGREDELTSWLGGVAGGGVNSDGKYPMTDAIGVTYQVKCPAQMQSDADAAAASISSGGMTGVMVAGSTGNIPAGQQFGINDSTGAKRYFSIDEVTGKVVDINLDGMAGNLANPLTDLPLNQIEYMPFASQSFTVTTPAADVTNYVGLLRTIGLTMTAAVPASAAGQYLLIADVYYPITVVSGAVVTLEYDSNLADPVAGNCILNTWRFAGKYAGQSTFTRASRKTYIDPLTGLLRAVPAGFPAFERMTDGRVGYFTEGASTNSLGAAFRHATAWTVWNGTSTATQAGTGVDGTTNGAVTITDTGAAVFSSRNIAVGAVVNDTSTHTVSICIAKNQANIPAITAQLAGGTTVNRTIRIDTATGILSTDSPLDVLVDDSISGFWRVKIPITDNATGNTTARIIAFPASRSTLNGADVVTLQTSCIFDWPQIELNMPFASSPMLGGVTRAADGYIPIQPIGNLTPTDFTLIWDGYVPLSVNLVSANSARYFGISDSATTSGVNSLRTYSNGTKTVTTMENFGTSGKEINIGTNDYGSLHRYALVSDLSGLKIYVDGILTSTLNAPITIAGTAILRIGGYIDSVIHAPYIHMRGLRVYDKALKISEIEAA